MKFPDFMQGIEGIDDLSGRVAKIHVVTAESEKSLREFLAALLSYMPGWMRWLYRVRWLFVRLLGTSQDGIPEEKAIGPEEVPFELGKDGSIFTVIAAQEERYWLGKASDAMIAGYFGVVAEKGSEGLTRYQMVTMVEYRRWTGRVYFFFINPFHHVVMYFMVRHATGKGQE